MPSWRRGLLPPPCDCSTAAGSRRSPCGPWPRRREPQLPQFMSALRDRDGLMRRLVDEATGEVMAILHPLTSVEAIFREYLRFSCAASLRVNLMVETFGRDTWRVTKMPAFESAARHARGRARDQGKEMRGPGAGDRIPGFRYGAGHDCRRRRPDMRAQLRWTALQHCDCC